MRRIRLKGSFAILLLSATGFPLCGMTCRADTLDPAELSKAVSALPHASLPEQDLKTVLALALERAALAAGAGMRNEADAILADVRQMLAKPVAVRESGAVPFLPPLREQVKNPCLDALYAWASADLAQPDIPWRKCTPDFNVFTGINKNYGTRDESEKMMRYIWLVGHPQSRYRDNPELLARLLRRAHAYLDAWDLHAKKYSDSLNDFFALGPALYSFMAIDRLWPGFILPGERTRWHDTIQRIAGFWLKVYADGKDNGAYRMGRYANRDLGVANILLNAGIYLKDQRCLDAARFLVHAQEENLYPDGGFAYIGTQNESCGYHDADITLLARYYLVSGDEKCRDLLTRSQWYGPLSMEPAGIADYWTPPSWKHAWNGGGSTGGEVVASLSGNPYLRELIDLGQARAKKTDVNLLGVMFYRSDIKPKALPDNYTVYDRNIQGPRARYGRFSYAATTRVPNPDEPGKATLMGAMIIDNPPVGGYPLNSALMLAMPQVYTPVGKSPKPVCASLTCGDRNAVTVGRHFSALSSEYALHTSNSSTKGTEVPWTAFQEWICIRDRIVGLLEIAPRGRQKAAAVNAVFRLGVGGTAAGTVKDIRAVDARGYEYGNMHITVHDHDFASLAPVETIVRRTKAYDLTFRDNNATQSDTLSEFEPGKPFHCIVEFRPKSTSGELTVKHETRSGGLSGLRVMCRSELFVLWRNRGSADAVIDLSGDVLPGVESSLHLSRASGKAPVTPAPAKITLAPGEQALVVSSADAGQHKPGWPSYQHMLEQNSD